MAAEGSGSHLLAQRRQSRNFEGYTLAKPNPSKLLYLLGNPHPPETFIKGRQVLKYLSP